MLEPPLLLLFNKGFNLLKLASVPHSSYKEDELGDMFIRCNFSLILISSP